MAFLHSSGIFLPPLLSFESLVVEHRLLGFGSAVSVPITHQCLALWDRFMISSTLSSNRRERRKNSALSEPMNAKQVSATCTESQQF